MQGTGRSGSRDCWRAMRCWRRKRGCSQLTDQTKLRCRASQATINTKQHHPQPHNTPPHQTSLRVITATSHNQFIFLAQLRYREANCLLRGKEWQGALYLAGYIAECALKAVIAKNYGGRLPGRFAIHDLAILIDEACKFINASDHQTVRAIPPWTHLYRYSNEPTTAKTAVNFVNVAKEIHRCLSTYL
ncbi:HEPN domain-containing protein [Corallococcus sp. AB045]|uniref:HEPN domain-containing protein n=1 Tax=Corallococcus sp. AB045 TaxID=2316719 RepID=UPI000EC08296|nr:HEPN domain-containing protein [Corallococcus sp. AB045]